MSNPMFNEAAFERAKQEQSRPTAHAQRETLPTEELTPRYRVAGASVMTLQGTINKTFFLLALCVAGGYVGWNHSERLLSSSEWWLNGTMLAAFAIAVLTGFKPVLASITAPVYAMAEGFCLGIISAILNEQVPGIILQAVLATGLVLAVMLFIYKTGILKVTQGFATAVVSATLAIAIMYSASLTFSLFGGDTSYLISSSPLSIGISVVVCIVAALNLMLDFQFISDMSSGGDAPKFMEWYAGFGLLVTIVWLYVEILILLSKFKRR